MNLIYLENMLDLPILSLCFMIIFIQFVIDVQIEGF